MSDEEFYSEESYEFEFEDGDDDGDVASGALAEEDYAIENKYYTAKGTKYDDPDGAIRELRAIVTSHEPDDDTRDWLFKCYKQMMKINFRRGRFDDVLADVPPMLQLGLRINQSYFEELLAKMMTLYTAPSEQEGHRAFAARFMDLITAFCNEENRFRKVWFRANLYKLGLVLASDVDEWQRLVAEIKARLGDDDLYALEVLAAEVEFYRAQPELDLVVLGELYRQLLALSTAVAHPRVLGIIREAGATVQFYRGNYDKARLLYYECFKCYDEVGLPAKSRALKHLALSLVLSELEFHPFSAQDTQAYAQLPEYRGLVALVEAHDRASIADYQKVVDELEKRDDPLVSDPVFRHAHPAILANLVAKRLITLLKAYSLVSFDTVCAQCHLDEPKMVALVLELVVAGKLANVKLDHVDKFIYTSDLRALPFSQVAGAAVGANLLVLTALGPLGEVLGSQGGQDTDGDVDMGAERVSAPVSVPLFAPESAPEGTAASQWLAHVRLAVPTPLKYEMNQKERVFSIQKRQQDETALPPPDTLEEPEPAWCNQQVRKIDILDQWATELGAKLAQLSAEI